MVPLVVPDRGGCWTERWDRAWCLSLSVGCTRSVFSLMVWHGVIRWSAKCHGARTSASPAPYGARSNAGSRVVIGCAAAHLVLGGQPTDGASGKRRVIVAGQRRYRPLV